MLKIRPEQLEVFRPAAEAGLAGRLAAHLKERHGEEVAKISGSGWSVKQIPDEILSRMAQHGFDRARRYGLGWESSLAAFVVLMFVVAPNFDEHPLIQRILKDESVPPDERIDRLWQSISEQNWEAASQGYDEHAWQLNPRP